MKPEQLEEALVARFISPGGFDSQEFVVVPSSPLVSVILSAFSTEVLWIFSLS